MEQILIEVETVQDKELLPFRTSMGYSLLPCPTF